MELVSWRVRAVAAPSVTELRFAEVITSGEALIERRPAYSPKRADFVATPVYARAALAPGTRIDGPALMRKNQIDRRSPVRPRRLKWMRFGNLIMRLMGNPG